MSQLKIEGVFDPSGIEQGAKQAEAAFDALGGDVANAADRATAAMTKLGEQPLGARLAPQIAKAALAVDDLRSKIEAAKRSGSPVAPEVTAQLARMEAALATSTQKLGKFKDELGDIGRKADQAGQGLEKMAGMGGSLQGMLGGLADTSGKFGSSMAKGALATIGLVEAFKLGMSEGKQLREVLSSLGVVSEATFAKFDKKWSGRFAEAIVEGNGFWDTLGRITSGVEALSDAEVRQRVNAKSAVGIQNEHKIALEKTAEALQKAIPGFEAQAKAQKESSDSVKALNAAVKEYVDSGQSLDSFVEKNKDALMKWAEELEKQPDALKNASRETQALYEKLMQLRTGYKAAADASAERTKQLAAERAEIDKLSTINLRPRIEVVNGALTEMARRLEEAADAAASMGKDAATGMDRFGQVASENKQKIQELIAQAESYGLKVPEALLQAMRAAQEYDAALQKLKDVKAELIGLGVKWTAEMDKETEAQIRQRVEVEKSTQAAKARNAEAQAQYDAEIAAIDAQIAAAKKLQEERKAAARVGAPEGPAPAPAAPAADPGPVRALGDAAGATADRIKFLQESLAAMDAEAAAAGKISLDLAQNMRAYQIELDAVTQSHDAVTEKLRGMATAVQPAEDGILGLSKATRDASEAMNGIARSTPIGGYLQTLANDFRGGTRSATEMGFALEELRRGMNLLNGMGGNFLGDVNTKINQMQHEVNAANDALREQYGLWADLPGVVDPVKQAMREMEDAARASLKGIEDAAASAGASVSQSMTGAASAIRDTGAALGTMGASVTVTAGTASSFGVSMASEMARRNP